MSEAKTITLTKKEVEEARKEDVVCLLGWSQSCSRKCREDTPAQHDLCKKLTQFASQGDSEEKGGEDE